MALSMIKSLKDTAEFTKALIEYLSLKNKVLYSGTAEWILVQKQLLILLNIKLSKYILGTDMMV